MFLMCLVIVILVMIVFHYHTRYSRSGKLIDKFSGPEPLPIIGNLLMFIKSENALTVFTDINKRYWPAWRIWLGNIPVISLQNPDDIKRLLSSAKHIEKGIFYEYVRDWLNDNLLVSTGKKWQFRRRLLLPSLNSSELDKYCDIVVEHGKDLVDALKVGKQEVTVERFLGKFLLNTICEIGFGWPIKHLSDEEIEAYLEAMCSYCEIMMYRIMRPWFHSNWIFHKFSNKGWKQKKNVKILHEFSSKIIRERKAYYISTTTNIDDSPKTLRKEPVGIDRYFAALNDGSIDESGIQEEVDGAILAGYETVVTTLTFTLQLLGEYTEIQNEARKEVNQMFESCGGKITTAELNQLVYLQRCLQESMRLYPAVPLITRQLREDLHLENRIVPSGCLIAISIYDLHRNPRIWTEPNKFDPDRFLPERSLNRSPYTYLPFSAGPRNCPGQKAGILELKVYCAYVLRNFYLEAVGSHENFTWESSVTIKPREEVRVKFTPINKSNSE